MPEPSRPSPAAETGLLAGAAVVVLVAVKYGLFAGWETVESLLLPVFFLYAPILLAYLTDRDLDRLGLGRGPAGRGAADLALFGLVILPLFLLGFFVLMKFGFGRSFVLNRSSGLGGALLWNTLGVALPEEVFFRGFLQERLDRLFPPRLGFLKARIGPGIFIAAAVFAAAHYLMIPRASRLLVFFPGLLFGLLRARAGSVLPGVFAHGLANAAFQFLQESMI
jgi:hypothetical protein